MYWKMSSGEDSDDGIKLLLKLQNITKYAIFYSSVIFIKISEPFYTVEAD